MQTKKFNDSLAKLGDKVNALTVSLDLPFAMNRFCGAESIKNMRVGSDYQDRNFGNNWGTLIEELKIESRAVFVLDKDGKVVYAQYVPEVASEPDYDPALAALCKSSCRNSVAFGWTERNSRTKEYHGQRQEAGGGGDRYIFPLLRRHRGDPQHAGADQQRRRTRGHRARARVGAVDRHRHFRRHQRRRISTRP